MRYVCAHVWRYVYNIIVKGPNGQPLKEKHNGRECKNAAGWKAGRENNKEEKEEFDMETNANGRMVFDAARYQWIKRNPGRLRLSEMGTLHPDVFDGIIDTAIADDDRKRREDEELRLELRETLASFAP